MHRIKKVTLAACIAAGMLLTAGAGPALAANPAFHNRFSFSAENVYPAGTLCNFLLDDTFTATVNFIAAPNGENATLVKLNVTHTNEDTGYSLTELDSTNTLVQAHSSTMMQVGLNWHLRDAGGQLVLVKAGEATIDLATGNLVSFTPNSGVNQTYAQVICPALGGGPA